MIATLRWIDGKSHLMVLCLTTYDCGIALTNLYRSTKATQFTSISTRSMGADCRG
jgi:hypothetical protein